MISTQPNILITLQYGQTTTLTYLSGPGGLYALHLINPDESESIRYIHTDHLGSWTAVSDEAGEVVDEQSYDAWGNRRNDSTWTNVGELQPPMFDRGFTGHEHLDGFQLVNMNGRMYDPVVSRMLAPDNFVQTPDFSQNFNRYSYALINPLRYTDPDGEWVHIVIGAVVGGVINVATNWDNLQGWEFAASFAVGAGSGALAAATGGASLGAQAAVALGTGALVSATNNITAQTDNFQGKVDWGSVGQSAVIGGVSGVASFGAARGVGSAFKGDIVLGEGFRISGRSIPGMAIKQGLAGFAGGYAGGFAAGYLYTGDLGQAGKIGLQGAYLGGGLGFGLGAGTAAYNAKRGGYNPWTGKFTEKSVRRTYNIPEGWNAEPTDGDGIRFVDPENRHNQYRFMNGNPNSQNPWQRNPYLQLKQNGQTIDATGVPLPNRHAPGSHIDIDITPKIIIRKPFLD
ncbi:MAG: RHS domain-containing protein [Bacteroidales bacterium]|nr:RHS domain-containing protein [Bacteroidales bacterium]